MKRISRKYHEILFHSTILGKKYRKRKTPTVVNPEIDREGRDLKLIPDGS